MHQQLGNAKLFTYYSAVFDNVHRETIICYART